MLKIEVEGLPSRSLARLDGLLAPSSPVSILDPPRRLFESQEGLGLGKGDRYQIDETRYMEDIGATFEGGKGGVRGWILRQVV